ncbi:hypothetical protein STFR1_20327 [Bacillus vallismortis]
MSPSFSEGNQNLLPIFYLKKLVNQGKKKLGNGPATAGNNSARVKHGLELAVVSARMAQLKVKPLKLFWKKKS